MKKLLCITLCLCAMLSLASCNKTDENERPDNADELTQNQNEHTEHTGNWVQNENAHYYQYTCGCSSTTDEAWHSFDDNNTCTVCGYIQTNAEEVAQAVLDEEQAFRESLDKLRKEHPETIFYDTSIAEQVYCSLDITGTPLTVKEIVEKYDLENLFANASVSVYDSIKTIYMTFERDDFTQAVYHKLKKIDIEEQAITRMSVSTERRIYRSYMPDIEYYTTDASAIEYTDKEKALFNLDEARDIIIKSRQEYDEYINYLLGLVENEYKKTAINANKDLYDEAFFEDNALIITRQVVRGSGSIKLTVNNVYLSGDKVYVVIKSDEPSLGTCDMQYRTFNIVVKKSDVAGVSEVITLD